MKYQVISLHMKITHLLSSHVKRSPLLCHILNGAFGSKSEMVWDFICVYIINRTLNGHLEIRNFSSHVKKIFHLFILLH